MIQEPAAQAPVRPTPHVISQKEALMIVETSPLAGDPAEQQDRIDAIVAAGPKGAFALAGAAVGVVLALWWIFYLVVYVARQA